MNIKIDCENKFFRNMISEILKELKKLAKDGDIEFQSSSKNMETFRILRRKHGITYEDFQDEILDSIQKLEIENYYQGPDEDDKPERGLIFWKFGTEIFEKEIYLKFHIREECGKKVVLWSYHIPEYKMDYPLKGRELYND